MSTALRDTRLRVVIVAIGVLLGLLAASLMPRSSYAAATVAPYDQLVGYGAGTTGGGKAAPVTVTTLAALQSAVAGNTAKVVTISGTITGNVNVVIGSNTTILGVGSTGSLVGISLDMKNVTNVIVRNLRISKVLANSTTGDAVHIEAASHIWIDHNDLSSDLAHGKDYYDGLLDITHAGDFVTVSWNRLHDHYKVSLVGHSDTNGAEDTGHLRVTYAHNWFYNANSRLPSLRFGTGHVFDNYFQNVGDSAVHSRENAQMLVEDNVFRSVATAITTTGDSKVDGYANARGNDYGGATVTITRTGSFTAPPYAYPLDPAGSVIAQVTTYSGVGIVDGSGGMTAPTAPTAPTTVPAPPTTAPPTTPVVPPTPTSTPPAPSGTLQAETATLTKASVSSAGTGWTGTGYVVLSGAGGSITWIVTVPTSGKHTLTVRYTNSSASNDPVALAVNGKTVKDNLTMKSTGAGWGTVDTGQALAQGANSVRITANAANAPHIDAITVS